MATYCEMGDKPQIKYKFGEGKERIYKSQFAPIEVIQKELPAEASDSYSSEGYEITFDSPQFSSGRGSRTVVDHSTFFVPPSSGYPNGRMYLVYIPCGQTTYPKLNPCTGSEQVQCHSTATALTTLTSTIQIDRTKKCTSTNQKRCSFQVLYKGAVVFQAQGDCPLTLSVQCGNCEEGSHECKHQAYPGYCCVPCKETGEKLKNIASSVRG